MSHDNDNYYNNDYEEYPDEEEEEEYYTHKDIEDQLYADGESYEDRIQEGASSEERQAHLTAMMENIDEAIDSRRRENEELQDDFGQLDGHEQRIEVLEANQAALALERFYAAQEADGGHNSGWDEEAGEWRSIREADYEAEGMGEEDMEIEDDSD